jgi:tetratricopeptide (TPR) repeat protein
LRIHIQHLLSRHIPHNKEKDKLIMGKSLNTSPQVNKEAQSSQLTEYALESSRTWFVIAQCALTLNLSQVALRAFESALRHAPDHVESLIGFTRTISLHAPQKTVELLQGAFQQFPHLNNEAALWKELAEAHLRLKQFEQAHQAATRGLSFQQNDPSLLFLSANALEHLNPQHAQHLYHAVLSIITQIRPGVAECDMAKQCHYKLGLMAMADQNWKAATSEFQAAISFALQINSDSELLWCLLANVRERSGDPEGALAVCRDAIQVSGLQRRTSIIFGYLSLIPTKSQQGDPINAINVLGPLAVTDHNDHLDSLTWYLLGRAHSLAGNPRQAYDAFQSALRKGRTSSLPWLAVGSLYLKMGQLPDALAAYSQAARLLIEDGSAISAQASAAAWDGLACVYERCDDQAIDAADAYARSASCYRAAGDMRAASQAEQRAHSLQAAARGEAPVPALKAVPETSLSLLRDIVIGAIQEDFANSEAAQESGDSKEFHHLPLPRQSLASVRSNTPTDKGIPVIWSKPVPQAQPQVSPIQQAEATIVQGPQILSAPPPIPQLHSVVPVPGSLPLPQQQTPIPMAPVLGQQVMGQPVAYYPPGVVWR